METQGTANNQAKDWRKKGLGWVPDYPDQRDYLSESEEDKKSGNLRRNEVTKSIEDIAENLLEVIEIIQDGFPINKKLKKLKTGLESKVFGQASFKKVKIYNRNLRLRIEPSSQINSQVINLKYYFEALSFHPKLSAYFQPKTILKYDDDAAKYWDWLNSEEFDDGTEKIVKEFQKQVKIREDGIVGRETYTAISNYLGDSNYSPPEKLTPLAYLLPAPIWIQPDTFKIIFDNLKSWWSKYNEGKNVETALGGLLDPKAPQSSSKFFEMFKQEFYVVEPIVSIINGMMSPFAIWDDLDSSLQNALAKFDNFDKEQDSFYKIGAIFMVNKRLEPQLKELKNQQEKSDQDKLTISFYEFVQAIVQGCIKKNTLKLSVDEQELLILFSTKYLFEIDTNQEENNKSPQKSRVETSSPTMLEVLINRNWDEKYVLSENLTYYAILPSIVDLSSWCSPIRDQGSINSCTAFAAAALLEYFARKAKDERTYVSPLFLYKVARNLMSAKGDVGASVRETMKAMVAFGVPPEKYWSYEADKFDEDPPAFCYSYAQNYKTLKYFRLDRPNLTKEILLFQIQATLAAEFPCIFGFTVYSSIYEEKVCSGCIPYPGKGDQVIGGHTVLAVGYDNYKEIKHSNGREKPTRGAFLIRNSWGTGWGQKGYGWLPYDYVLNGLTADWWSLIKAEWFETGNFGLGAHAPKDPGGPGGRD